MSRNESNKIRLAGITEVHSSPVFQRVSLLNIIYTYDTTDTNIHNNIDLKIKHLGRAVLFFRNVKWLQLTVQFTRNV